MLKKKGQAKKGYITYYILYGSISMNLWKMQVYRVTGYTGGH